MGQITKPTTFVDGTVPTASQFNGDFDTVYNEFNGNIQNSNIASNAAIALSKISGTAVNLSDDQTITGVKTFDEEVILKQKTTPSNPSANYNKLYFKSDNQLYSLNNSGTESVIGGGQNRVHIKRSAAQSISNDSDTAIQWDQEDFDTNSFHDNSTNNTRITIPTNLGGVYLIIFNGRFAFNATGERFFSIRKNGTTTIARSRIQAITSNGQVSVQNIAVFDIAVETDYYEALVYQSSGGALNFDNTAGESFLQAIKIG